MPIPTDPAVLTQYTIDAIVQAAIPTCQKRIDALEADIKRYSKSSPSLANLRRSERNKLAAWIGTMRHFSLPYLQKHLAELKQND